ncbi:hypothetical protein JN531_012150 [Flagellatimonas centrodinii]|uniref:hypothetical protein n=1 Tax=Flagellatimonas centrodinii TaxID=2806210 RepID=UPI001FEDE570|nr:hypothetical protein [Flagellatimonas centrodinii]ULQ45852.1 hypothetical protein JN531_012150 [Flagellatimonas centrodinii]
MPSNATAAHPIRAAARHCTLCGRPVSGPHRLTDNGAIYHLSCAEADNIDAPGPEQAGRFTVNVGACGTVTVVVNALNEADAAEKAEHLVSIGDADIIDGLDVTSSDVDHDLTEPLDSLEYQALRDAADAKEIAEATAYAQQKLAAHSARAGAQ